MADIRAHRLDDPALAGRARQMLGVAIIVMVAIGLLAVAVHLLTPGRGAGDPMRLAPWFLMLPATLLAFAPLLLGPSLDLVSPDEPLRGDRAADPLRRNRRRHRRFAPRHRSTMLTTLDGRVVAARIVDLSIAGVAVEAKISNLEYATVERVGARRVSPMRRTAGGAVFGFETLLDPLSLDDDIVL